MNDSEQNKAERHFPLKRDLFSALFQLITQQKL